MKKSILFCILAIMGNIALATEVNLLHNAAFWHPKPYNDDKLLKERGIAVEGDGIPYSWRITAHKPKAVNGKVVSRKSGKRVFLSFSSDSGEIIFYNFTKIRLNAMGNKKWKLLPRIHGDNEAVVVAYGYDDAGKCVYFKRFSSFKLNSREFPAPFIISAEELNGNGAVAVCIGIGVKGKATLYSFSMVPAVDGDIKKNETSVVKSGGTLTRDSFEAGNNWTLVKHDGAEGCIKTVDGGRTGRKALKIVKTNSKGFLQLVSKQPVRLSGGGKYVFRGYFQSQKSTLDTLLLFRLTDTPGDKAFHYDSVDRSFGFPAQSLLINSNPGEWCKRVISCKPEKDCQVYLNVLVSANPVEVLLDDLEVSEDNYRRPSPNDLEKRTAFPYSEAQVMEILNRRKIDEAFLKCNGNRVEMMLNGHAVLPVFYRAEGYFNDYVYNRYSDFEKAGVPFVFRRILMSWGKDEPGVVLAPGKYNFEKINKTLMLALRQNPKARLVVDFHFNEPYPGWGRDHSDEIWQNGKGEYGWGSWGNIEGFTSDISKVRQTGVKKKWKVWPFASYSSISYRRENIRAVKEIVSYLMSTPAGKAIVGFQITGGHDGQFQYASPDYSPAAQKSFRKYLQGKYRDIQNLNCQLQSSYSSFEEIRIPAGELILTPKKPMARSICSEYKAFQRNESWSLKHSLADAAKTAAGKRIFVSSWGLPVDYHAGTFARYKGGVDLFCVPSWYPFRQQGYPIGAKPDATFALYGKMWVNEMDCRTWTESARNEVYDMWVGAAVNLPCWQSVNRKFAGVSLAHHSAYIYYSMYRYFDRPEVMDEIRRSTEAAKKLLSAPVNFFRPDVCVIRSEEGDDIRTAVSSSDFNSVIFPYQYMQMELSGVPYDVHELNDVMNNPALHDYKMYVFMHTAILTEKDRQVIEKLKKSGKLLVFMHSSGYFDEKDGRDRNISRLTSFAVKSEERFSRGRVLLEKHPLTEGLPQEISGGDFIHSLQAVRRLSHYQRAYQVFRIMDSRGGEVLARYTDGSIAAAIRGNVVYSAAPFSLSAGLFHRLARRAGAFWVAEPGQSIHMNGNFISLHGTTPGQWTLNLPPGVSQVTDLFSGKKIPVKNGTFTFPVENGKSYWLMMTGNS